MNPTLKRLEEIEAVCHEDAHLVGWLCARLRDALAVIAQAPLAEATAAYRRLFGHAEVGEMLPAKLPLSPRAPHQAHPVNMYDCGKLRNTPPKVLQNRPPFSSEQHRFHSTFREKALFFFAFTSL